MLDQFGPAVEFPVKEEYEKNPWINQEDIRKLRKWIQTQPHLPSDYITDLDLILVYHFCKGSPEVAKQMLDQHYTMRTHFTYIFQNRRVDKSIRKALKVITPTMLPERAPDGSIIIYVRIRDPDPKNLVFVDSVRAMFMMSDLYLYEKGTSPGLVVVFDVTGLVLGHITRVDITILQQTFQFIQKGFLHEIKGLHFLNSPPILDKALALLKSMMTDNMIDLMHVHTPGSRTIEKFVPLDILPKEDQYEIAKDQVLMKINNNEEFFLKEEKKRVKEYLRPERRKDKSDNFEGLEGSFKKLDID